MNGIVKEGHEIDRFHVVTGGPGAGKTTLLAALAARGLGRSVEAGRTVIQAEVEAGGRALPWADRAAFADAMLAHELDSYRQAAHASGPRLFNRGLPDIVGYRRLVGLAVPAALDRAVRSLRYNRRVFIASPWRDIYAQDEERKQSWDEAQAIFHAVAAAYIAYGYELVALPLAAVAARVDFVLEAIGGEMRCT